MTFGPTPKRAGYPLRAVVYWPSPACPHTRIDRDVAAPLFLCGLGWHATSREDVTAQLAQARTVGWSPPE